MHPIYAQVFYGKKEAFAEGGITALANTASGGRDPVQANVEADEEDRMSDENVIANMRFVSRSNLPIYSDNFRSPSGFILGGQETAAGAISRLLDLMTSNPMLQTWLREEITEALALRTRIAVMFEALNGLLANCRRKTAFLWIFMNLMLFPAWMLLAEKHYVYLPL